MELTNEQRKYLGLEIIEPTWERVEIPSNCVKPEQSNPFVLVPPYTYLHPKNCFAYATTELPFPDVTVSAGIVFDEF